MSEKRIQSVSSHLLFDIDYPRHRSIFPIIEEKYKPKQSPVEPSPQLQKKMSFIDIEYPVTSASAFFRPVSPRPQFKPQFLFSSTLQKKNSSLELGSPYLPRNPRYPLYYEKCNCPRTFSKRQIITNASLPPLSTIPNLILPKTPFK